MPSLPFLYHSLPFLYPSQTFLYQLSAVTLSIANCFYINRHLLQSKPSATGIDTVRRPYLHRPPSTSAPSAVHICTDRRPYRRRPPSTSAPSAVHICTDRRPYRRRPPRMARAEPITPELLSFSLLYNANLLQYSENSGEKVLNHFVFSYLFDNFGVNY